MPLVPCPDCGRQVSTAALSCPQCGRPDPAGRASRVFAAPETPSGAPLPGEGTPTPAASEPAPAAYQPPSSPSADGPSDLTKLLAGAGAFFALVLAIGMCSQSGSVASSASTATNSTPLGSASDVPALSAADSARFRLRAREIVQEHKPAGWPDAERSRMIALADTVIFFGDTADAAVRSWLAARREADEARIREEAAAAERLVDAAKWGYASEADPMASRPSRTASIQSENAVEFSFPYEGPQHATLLLRDHPSYGKDVIVYIGKGQILCSSYQECSIRVRFDEGPAERWDGVGPADNSTTSVFIRNDSRFVQRMRNAKVVRIQIPVYQQGAPAFEFRVGGFDHDRYTRGS